MAEYCQHEWVQGPFYLKVAKTYEEPNFYPPNAMIRIEHCKKCGLIRLPPDLKEYDGENLSQGKNSKKSK